MKWIVLLILNLLLIQASNGQGLIVKPGRTISFTTDEGSYMNVDVSPDDKTLLFDLLGDIYSVPSCGGTATQITRGIALHLRPVWSPDGRNISYISDSTGQFRLSVMDLANRSQKIYGRSEGGISSDATISWSPDGKFISADESVYHITGIKMENEQAPIIRFSSYNKLLYRIDSGWICSYNLVHESKIKLMKIPSNAYDITLSPDNHWCCFLVDSNSKKSLIAQNIITGHRRTLLPSLIVINPFYTPNVPPPHYSFDTDSKNLFIAYGGKIHKINIDNGSDVIIPFIAHVKSDLGPFLSNKYRVDRDSVKVKYTRSANLSPDGKEIVFSALSHIYKMDVKTNQVKRLTSQANNQFQPVYSPDGKSIAYVSWCDTTGGFLWKIDRNGGTPQKIADAPGVYQRPCWSPDGRSIACIKADPVLVKTDDRELGQLEIISLENKQVKLVDTTPLRSLISFSTNGKKIFYTPTYKGGRPAIQPGMVSKEIGTGDISIVAIGSEISAYQQKLISPDQRYIVSSIDEDIYLYPIYKSGNPVLISNIENQFAAIKIGPGVDPSWVNGGKTLLWSYGNKVYKVDVDKILSSATGKVQTEIKDPLFLPKAMTPLAVSVAPDKIYSIKLSEPSITGKGLLVLNNARILTMHGDKVIERGTIVIRNDRIVAVGPQGSIIRPAGAKAIDLAGKTIMPGFIDLHLHMEAPSDIFPQQSWMYLANLAYGVTTGRNPASTFDSFGYAELLNSGKIIGPRLYTTGQPVIFNFGVINFDSLADARDVVHKRTKFDAKIVKEYLLTPRIRAEWLLTACREAGINMTHEGGSEPLGQFAFIKDGGTGVEHNPAWGDVYEDVFNFYAKSQTYFTPTLQVASADVLGKGKAYFNFIYWHGRNEKMERFLYSDPNIQPSTNGPESFEAIEKTGSEDSIYYSSLLTTAKIDAKIRHLGGRVTLGSHGNDEGIGAHNELWALQMGGLTNMEALQAATIMGAEGLGVQKDLGSIEVGKIADLIVLNKNPLDDIHNSREIKYVMKDGILYDGDTLDEIWPVYKKCPEWRIKKTK